ncbi:hypothetical protein LPJ61_004097 [Coemansia biformis]|uniref:F-box domain-containing protein n=1 Tax=Coemansia biformis TaxID=1286918 RepID=A0A9W7YBJ8_9FUNG|nr:hypothetical protein LPJ61_004097 [Coemansia biformis]
MVCLGHSCRIYDAFDPAQEDCCLTVHRSCYTLLLDKLDRTEGAEGGMLLMQRVMPYINSQGVVSPAVLAGRGKGRQRQHAAGAAAPPAGLRRPEAWLTCDPTDLPAIPPAVMSCSPVRGARRYPVPPPLLPGRVELAVRNSTDHTWALAEVGIPRQLLTPPTTPTEGGNHTFVAAADEPAWGSKPPKHNLLTLPPHMLLAIVSHLCSTDITALSQTCSALQRYLSTGSPVWGRVCRLALRYTPKYLSNQQMAEYYLRVRGNSRLEDRVLVQRERVEQIIHHIAHLPLPAPS